MRTLVALLFLLLSAGWVRAQVNPHTRTVVFFPSQQIVAGTTRGAIIGTLGVYRHALCQFDLTVIAGTTYQLDVFLQSFPDGTNPDDYLCFTTIISPTAAPLTFEQSIEVPIAAQVSHARRDASVGGGRLGSAAGGAGVFGDKLRVAAVLSGTGGPQATFSVSCQFSTQ